MLKASVFVLFSLFAVIDSLTNDTYAVVAIDRYGDQSNNEFLNETGYWVYGFEQSLFLTCEGKLYWMWTPSDFKGKYSQEGSKNPVLIEGYIKQPNPIENMGSTLETIVIKNIQHVQSVC
ncbi:hypothetical protein FLL45_18570 [Aliikangiella marina]|uniref:Uncharacterized protein n=1 Tax=Aliikangiella marina TaxID=1712262 RepID=A0A545T4S2_9GAMM|nr:hypothetical protein [Aliikangiella marina]TQV72224.1 hypothetical protein FLL45_18570 [Aliikangiella marina]